MSKKNNRFEKMELDISDVPKKPTLLEKMKFKRKLELGNEAQAERIGQDMKKISADLDKQIEENERRQAIQRQREMVRTIEKNQKDELMDLEIKKQYAMERKQRAQDKIWIFITVAIGVVALVFIGRTPGKHFLIEIVIGIIVAIFGYRGRRRW